MYRRSMHTAAQHTWDSGLSGKALVYPSALHLGQQPFNFLESTTCPDLEEATRTRNSLADNSVLVVQSGQVDINEREARAEVIQDHGVCVPQGLLEVFHHLNEVLATSYLEAETVRQRWVRTAKVHRDLRTIPKSHQPRPHKDDGVSWATILAMRPKGQENV